MEEEEPAQIVDDAAQNVDGEEPRPSQHLGQMRQTELNAAQAIAPVKPVYKYKYASWREDKEADAGFTKELISCDSEKISDQTSLDALEVWPF